MINRIKNIIIAVVLMSIPLCVNHFNDYLTYKDYDVTVVEVMSGMSSGKYSSLKFIAVYELPNGYRFDQYISASTTTWMKPGQQLTLNLRPFDVQQTPKDTAFWVFGGLVLNLFGFGFGALYWARAAFTRFDDWCKMN